MNGTLILDSNAIIDLLDGRGEVSTIMDGFARILIPAVVLGELKAGCPGITKREAKTRELIEKLLGKPLVSILPVSRGTADFYATVFNYVRSKGTPIPVNDIWIASAALETGGVICTNDHHLLGLPLIQTRQY